MNVLPQQMLEEKYSNNLKGTTLLFI